MSTWVSEYLNEWVERCQWQAPHSYILINFDVFVHCTLVTVVSILVIVSWTCTSWRMYGFFSGIGIHTGVRCIKDVQRVHVLIHDSCTPLCTPLFTVIDICEYWKFLSPYLEVISTVFVTLYGTMPLSSTVRHMTFTYVLVHCTVLMYTGVRVHR